jgi:hypothetical protein
MPVVAFAVVVLRPPEALASPTTVKVLEKETELVTASCWLIETLELNVALPVTAKVLERVVLPITTSVLESVVLPVTANVLERAVLPVTASVFANVTLPFTTRVLETVVLPVTARVLEKVVLPVTTSVLEKATELVTASTKCSICLKSYNTICSNVAAFNICSNKGVCSKVAIYETITRS